MIDKNKSLPVLDIIQLSFANIFAKIKSIFILSYAIALFVYGFTMLLPNPANSPEEASFLARASYLLLFFTLLLMISISFYRLLASDIRSYRDLIPDKPIIVILKMILYLAGLLFLLFVAELAVSLLFLLIAAIANNISDTQILNESNLPPLVYFTMLVVSLLILMRLQPTFISIATNRTFIPMKSSYYYTRDNNKALVLIGLFSFAPAMMPIVIVFYAISGGNGAVIAGNIVTFLVFPLFLLPYLAVLSAGIEVNKYLLPNLNPDEVEN